MQYSEKDKTINDLFYGYFLRHNMDDGWGDKDKYGNFKLLTDIAHYTNKPLADSSVLDVGCGTGDFADYLKQQGVTDYLGIDLYDMSIDYARMKYPKEKFVTGDFLAYDFNRTFDYVFCSGAVAAILDTDNYKIMTSFVKKMWELAHTGVAFNFLTREYEKEKDEELFLYDLDEVLRICREKTKSAQIEHIQNRAGDSGDFLQTHIYLLRSAPSA